MKTRDDVEREVVLARVAEEHLGLETLWGVREKTGTHNVRSTIAQVRLALEAAYQAGQAAARQDLSERAPTLLARLESLIFHGEGVLPDVELRLARQAAQEARA